MKLAVVTAIAVLATVALPTASNASVATGEKSFQQCGDYPSDFTYGLRVDGVGCSRGKKVSERWYRIGANNNFPNPSRVGSWRCKSQSYGDGVDVKCKSDSKEVRFAFGG